MGNCLVVGDKSVISVMKTDGEIMEYKAPIRVEQVVSEFSHHAISDKIPAVKHLHPSTELIKGRLYYLLPLPVVEPKKKKKKKKVRFSEDVVEEEKRSSGVVRIKVVITKKELRAMLEKSGVCVEDVGLKGRAPAMEKMD